MYALIELSPLFVLDKTLLGKDWVVRRATKQQVEDVGWHWKEFEE